ncbi:hypothetical protein AB6D92_22405 [Vibrio splendidus]
MKINLDKSLFKDDNRISLMSILYSALGNMAYLCFDMDDDDILDWISQNSCDDWKLANDIYVTDSANFRLSNKINVTDDIANSDWSLPTPEVTLSDACILISKPIEIWVENAINDGAFVKLILSRTLLNLFESWEAKSRVEFTTRGGIGDMKKTLLIRNNDMGHRNKRFVLCDSDALQKGKPHREANVIINTCTDNKIPHHCLERRSIENYLPIDYLINSINVNARPTNNKYKKYNAFKKLSEDLRHYYHMKEGINHTPLYKSGLYDHVMDTILTEADLWTGFSNKYADRFLSAVQDREEIRKLLLIEDKYNELTSLENRLIEYIRVPV